MTDEPNPSNLFNPMMLWADAGLRAMDMTLSSSQSLSDNVDRLTRASADMPTLAGADAPAWGESAASSSLALASSMQRTMFDLVTQGWVQWMSALGAFASLPGDRRWAAAMRVKLPFDTGGAGRFASGTGAADNWSSERSGQREKAGAGHRHAEHAIASAEPKQRRGASRARPGRRARRT